jgi:hypothetical protein
LNRLLRQTGAVRSFETSFSVPKSDLVAKTRSFGLVFATKYTYGTQKAGTAAGIAGAEWGQRGCGDAGAGAAAARAATAGAASPAARRPEAASLDCQLGPPEPACREPGRASPGCREPGCREPGRAGCSEPGCPRAPRAVAVGGHGATRSRRVLSASRSVERSNVAGPRRASAQPGRRASRTCHRYTYGAA